MTEQVHEPLHDELDRLDIPFRSTRGELIEQFGDISGSRWVALSLPMTVGFVESQIDSLSVWVHPRRDTDHPCPTLTGTAGDFAAAVADLQGRFGAPADTEDADGSGAVRWRMGDRSVITVEPEPTIEGQASVSCRLSISHGYLRPHTGQEVLALAGFQQLHSDAANSLGWTDVGGFRWFMRLVSRHFVRLTDPADIEHVLVTDYEAARAAAFSTIELRLRSGSSESLAQGNFGSFASIAQELASELGVELTTVRAKST